MHYMQSGKKITVMYFFGLIEKYSIKIYLLKYAFIQRTYDMKAIVFSVD